ncbi:MAG: 30S ribosomal protein S24e [Thermoprotei archaeon]
MTKTVKIGEYTAEIVEEKYNPLIKRKEVVIKIAHIGKSTPPKGLVRIEVAKLYGTDLDRVYVRKLETEYGIGVTNVYVHIYDSVERARKFEPEHIIKRNEYAVQAYQSKSSQKEGEGG